MKKIFAIALALVMVLSMASAFAFCDVIDWSTKSNCGMGKVEVVTYAMGNKAGGGNTFTETDCAGAVNNQYVYFAIRVTVDPSPNQDWWKQAALKATGAGLKNSTLGFDVAYGDLFDGKDAAAGTYYLNQNAKLQKDVYRFEALVDDAAAAKVCATLVSEGVSDSTKNAAGVEINGSTVKVGAPDANGNFDLTVDDVVFTYAKDGSLMQAAVNGNVYTKYDKANDIFEGVASGKIIVAAATCDNTKDYAAIKAAMGAIYTNWDLKITRAKAVATLYKYDKVEDCATWSSDALAVVNPDCFVMEIPKTGDASVLAWLF